MARPCAWTVVPESRGPSNPFINAANPQQRYVVTYGHRNVQGLAQRRDGSVWSVEHGSYRDDEVNLLEDGGDYGWNPVPGYNESVPMTDQSLPGPQINAKWSSGNPTIATSGAAWVRGEQWGRYNGTLAVAALAGNRVVFMKFDKAGALTVDAYAAAAAVLRPAPLGHQRCQRRPADHHRQRRRQRRRPAGAPAGLVPWVRNGASAPAQPRAVRGARRGWG